MIFVLGLVTNGKVGAQGPGLVAVDSWVTNFGLLRRRRGGRLTREGQGQLSRRGPPATSQAKTHGGQNTPPPESITANRTALTAPRHSGKRTATKGGPPPKSPRSRHKSYSCKGLVLHESMKTGCFGLQITKDHSSLFWDGLLHVGVVPSTHHTDRTPVWDLNEGRKSMGTNDGPMVHGL